MDKKPTRMKRQLPAKVGGINIPKTEMHRAFCRAWLMHYDHNLAAVEAGFSKKSVNRGIGKELFSKYAEHLTRGKELKEKQLAKELALDQKDILKEMMAIGFANAQDYAKEVESVVGGKTVKQWIQKPLHELTRGQAAAISKVSFHNGGVTYEIPDEKSKHPYLRDLGQHLGLFHPALIHEHRHEHRHRALSFRDMDVGKLAAAEKMMIEALGPEGRRMLGIQDVQDAEFEDVTPK